jgi:hypothetical protein
MAAGASSSAFRRLAAPLVAHAAWRDLGLGVLLALLCGVLPVFATTVAPPGPAALTFNAAEAPAGVRLEQAYGGERNADGPFVWTKPQASIVVELPGDGPYEVSLSAQDSPLAPAPRALAVALDGRPAGEVPLSTAPQTFHFRHDEPRGAWHTGRLPLRIDLATPPLAVPGDPRALGLILRDVTVRPLAPPLPGLAWAALAPGLSAAGLYALARVVGARQLPAAVGVALGAAAAWGLLLAQQPRLPLWLGAALARQPVAALAAPVALSVLAALARAWPRVLVPGLLVALVAVPAALQLGVLARLIWGDPVQVPWFDEFFQFAFLFDARRGILSWDDLWQPYGGAHRTVFPRLLYAAVLAATPWDRRVWLTVNPLLIGVAFACLAAIVRRTVPSRRLALGLIAAIGGLLFALSQYGHWLLPFGLQFGLVVCCGALALWALSARPVGWPQLALAIGATWLASWSSLQGLALWIALLPLVVAAGWRKAAAWAACAAAVIVTYAINLPASSTATPSPGDALGFTLVSLGAPLGVLRSLTARGHFWSHLSAQPESRWALFLGAASIALLVVNLLALWRQRRAEPVTMRHALPWCCLALFALACAVVTALGRAADGPGTALTSRYHTFALLWWIALLVLGAQATASAWRPSAHAVWPGALAATNLLALAIGIGCFSQVTLVSGLLAGDLHGDLRRAETCARDLGSAPDSCLALLHPVPSVARLRLAQLADARLALYRDDPPPPSAPAADPATVPEFAPLRRLPFGALYAVDGLPGPLSVADGLPPVQLRVAATQPVTITGWAIDVSSIPPRPALGVFIAIDDAPPIWVSAGEPHPVPSARFSPSLALSGFHLTLPPGSFRPGQHSLRLTVVTAGGEAAYEVSPPLVFIVE